MLFVIKLKSFILWKVKTMYKEYGFEESNLSKNKAEVPLGDYKKMHENLPISCHDVFIKYKGGILLGKRKNHPAKDSFWPIGGRMKKGISSIESLKEKAMEECGLEIKNIEMIGFTRTFFRTDPFSHGKGSDTPNLIFFAD